MEGNSGASDPFTSSSFRLQMVFDASQFAIPAGASGRIDSIWFRLDNSAVNDPVMFFSGGAVTASTTPVGPDGLSSVFANNWGPNAVAIFSGAMSFGGLYQAGANPQPFRQTFIAASPFWYNPQQGNLLLDIFGAGGQPFIPGQLDAHLAAGDSVSRVFANSDLASSGVADTLGFVTHIDFTVVPEPSTWAIIAIGLLVAAAFRRKN